MDLKELREQIDITDRQIAALYEQRMDIARRVAEYKIANGKNIFDKAREAEKLEQVKGFVENDFNKKGVQELFEHLMAMSRKLQYKMITERGFSGNFPFQAVEKHETEGARVVVQGAEGSYSDAAMMKYFGNNISCCHMDTFREAMEALEEGRYDYAILPIENSTAGSVSEIYDLLTEFDCYIVGEQIIRIEHCLMGIHGTKKEDIRTVLSHPQSLLQSADYLSRHPWQQIGMRNNAFAARKVAEERDMTQAAVAGEQAAEIYGLEILEKGINSSRDNSTRFIIVSNRKVFRTDAKKISICIELPHQSGSLYNILSHFIYNNLNMTKIESRPVEDRSWEYRFFIDFEGNLAQSAVKNALRGIREEAKSIKILGNY